MVYEGREMIVSKGVDSDGDLKLIDAVQSGVLAIAKALEVNEGADLSELWPPEGAKKAIGGALAVKC